MANNRLYIVDKSTKEYLCIAKGYGIAWEAGNAFLYNEFLKSRTNDNDNESHLIIGHENDPEFYKQWIENGSSFNKENKWNTFLELFGG